MIPPRCRRRLDTLRDEFGDEVGFYFGFLSHYIYCLGILGAVGVVFTIAFALAGSRDSKQSMSFRLIWALFVLGWSMCFLRSWSRRAGDLQSRWQIPNVDGVEVERKEFTPLLDADPLDPSKYPAGKRVMASGTLAVALSRRRSQCASCPWVVMIILVSQPR